ncbi:divalent-cation tolerance protein CutA [Ramlibacter albus]|uniref:divalent-cation tolerance protein CutA n=1 Tax=Ramlibacter albus TaxID=2079448 RepID=UPI001C9AB880|nr:divalent-cation tolerance protein CutA [Ramlibacter albus]
MAITTTVASRADGERLARELVERRLAACVQLDDGLTSFYRWKGELCAESEVRLVIKTLPQARASIEAFFREQHPYDVPQFLAVPMSASDAYAQWAREQVVLTAAAPAQTPAR